ncbi:glycosyltransferase family 2 protein [Oscillospiraceae bacterium HV4-5-C5C]|nr:glycosyltransferase family 2 protein [Oscillospiraceae bacterium HV4-5-C5C]
MSKVSVGVVTYNSRDVISDLLDSIIANTIFVTYKIYVVDNHSSDGTADYIKTHYKNITVISLPYNGGFGYGHNQLLDVIDSDYHVIINPDIVLKTDVISSLAEYLDEHPNVAMVTPKIENADGSEQSLPKRKPTFKYLVSGRLKGDRFQQLRDEYTMKNSSSQEPFDIEFSTGCFSMIRTSVFKAVHGFDERYFMYMEDADLSLRVRQLGRVMYNPSVSVIHKWERASAKHIKFLLTHIGSMIKFFWKWKS